MDVWGPSPPWWTVAVPTLGTVADWAADLAALDDDQLDAVYAAYAGHPAVMAELRAAHAELRRVVATARLLGTRGAWMQVIDVLMDAVRADAKADPRNPPATGVNLLWSTRALLAEHRRRTEG